MMEDEIMRRKEAWLEALLDFDGLGRVPGIPPILGYATIP